MTSRRTSAKLKLRRSFSEQLRTSTSKAWDLLWKNVRERRLAGQYSPGAPTANASMLCSLKEAATVRILSGIEVAQRATAGKMLVETTRAHAAARCSANRYLILKC